MVQLPGQQGGVKPSVQGVEHRTECRHRVVGFDHLGRVGQHGADCLAAAYTVRLECCGQARGALARLRPGVAALTMDHGG